MSAASAAGAAAWSSAEALAQLNKLLMDLEFLDVTDEEMGLRVDATRTALEEAKALLTSSHQDPEEKNYRRRYTLVQPPLNETPEQKRLRLVQGDIVADFRTLIPDEIKTTPVKAQDSLELLTLLAQGQAMVRKTAQTDAWRDIVARKKYDKKGFQLANAKKLEASKYGFLTFCILCMVQLERGKEFCVVRRPYHNPGGAHVACMEILNASLPE